MFKKLLAMARRTEPSDALGSIYFINGMPKAGVPITEETALTNSAVFASIALISNSVGMLPWNIHQVEYDGETPKRTVRRDLSLADILANIANGETGAYVFRKSLLANALGWGNGYAEVDRTRAGDVGAMWQITADRVNPDRDSRKRLFYDISNSGAANTTLEPKDIFHLRDFSTDGIVGKSRVTLAREAIAHGLAMEAFGSTLFGNGANFSGFLRHPGNLTVSARDKLLASIKEKFVGPSKSNQLGVLWEGMEYIKTTIPPEDAQFLESRQFHVADIARWYNLPPHKIGDLSRATFNNIEEMNRETVTSAYMPWIMAMEQEANVKLLTRDQRAEGIYTKMNVNALLRGDMQARSEYYKSLQEYGDLSINEVRGLEELNPIEGGNTHTIPMNRQPVGVNSNGTV